MKFFFMLILLFLQAALLAEQDHPDQGTLPKIEIVRTWKDLSAAASYKLQSGDTVRLGIEALAAPSGSAFLVYALVEGNASPIDHDGEALGPLRVDIVRDGHLEHLQKTLLQRRVFQVDKALFAKSVQFQGTGRHRVFIYEGEKPIATATIECAPGTLHPWTCFRYFERDVVSEAVADEIPTIEIGYAGGNAANPKVEGHTPLLSISEKKFKMHPESPLPRLLNFNLSEQPAAPNVSPAQTREIEGLIVRLNAESVEERAEASAGLRDFGSIAQTALQNAFKATGDPEVRSRTAELLNDLRGEFVIRATEEGVLITLLYPVTPSSWLAREKFLAQWWINGRPYSAPEKEDELEQLSELLRYDPQHTFILKIDLNKNKIGIRSGDRIGLRLMHCPDGFERAWIEMATIQEVGLEQLPQPDSLRLRIPIVSNRIEFKAP